MKPGSVGFGVVIGVVYGLCVQIAARTGHLKDVLGVMSFGFVFLLPLALGFVTAHFGAVKGKKGLWAFIVAPQVTILACLAAAMLLGWEGLICLLLGMPIYVFMGALGGAIAWVSRRMSKQPPTMLAAAFMLFPPIAAAIESKIDAPIATHEVDTSIVIEAPLERVWANVIRVEPITEPITGFFYRMGFPKPISATLSKEGEGGVREARFDRELVFIETVDAWEEQKTISFSIAVDPTHTPLTTLDPHVTVGGQYFDVMRGTYRLEPRAHDVVLHLQSKFRLSTHFNPYAGLWGAYLMSDIQNSILRVLKDRAERR